MMKAFYTLFFLLNALLLTAQADKNLELLSETSLGEQGNDIWGYIDGNGTEYAVIGSFTKTSIFEISDPTNPKKIAEIPGASSVWRDIKSYRDHIYVTTDDFANNEEADGLTIIDMSQAPDTVTYTKWKPNIDVSGAKGILGECHNIYIDTVQGYCYLSGCQGVGRAGVIILDLKDDLKNPTIKSAINKTYSHDVFVENDKLYTSDIYLGELTIYDVSDKSNPVELGNVETTTKFTHNAWASPDGKYAFTTDEKPGGKVDAYDVSDPANIKRLDFFRPIDRYSDRVIPHNTHYLNGYLYTSWYTEGMVIVDANKPDNLVKIASYDTYKDESKLGNGSWFGGLWGTTPFLPSGLILGSDMQKGLFIWKPTGDALKRACYLEGNVTSEVSGEPISGATIEIVADDANKTESDIVGIYKTGLVTSGSYTVKFSHPNYEPLELSAELQNGEVTILDAKLASYASVNAVTVSSDVAIAGTKVIVENTATGYTDQYTTDADGKITFPATFDATYNIYAAKWGYRGVVRRDVKIEDTTSYVAIALEPGYEDDFFADLGWTVSTDARTGAWERGIPEMANYAGNITQTSEDLPNDLGKECYVTGRTAASAGSNDIDNGKTTVTSPQMDFTDYPSVKISYHLFFSNAGGQGNPPPALDDDVKVTLSNGTESIELIGLTTPNFSWSDSLINIISPKDIQFTDDMTVSFTARDEGAGHLAEAQLDGFYIEKLLTTSVEDISDVDAFSVYPNPTRGNLTIESKSLGWSYAIYDAQGRRITEKKNIKTNAVYLSDEIIQERGMYVLQLTERSGKQYMSKVVRM